MDREREGEIIARRKKDKRMQAAVKTVVFLAEKNIKTKATAVLR